MRKRVLIVEDDPGTRQLLGAILSDFDVDIHEASRDDEAPHDAHAAVEGVVVGLHRSEPTARPRLDEHVLVAGSALVDLDPGHHPVHPVADRARPSE